MSLYVSSGCIRESDLSTNLICLKNAGFNNVELTGGIAYQPDFSQLIESLRQKYGVNIQLHNYSPPPVNDFVLNLGSLDELTFRNSVEHVKRSAWLTKQLELGKYAVHAGFYIPIKTSELGKVVSDSQLFDKKKVYDRFVETVNEFYQTYDDILYIENNVVSAANYKRFGQNLFMLTCSDEYFELKESVPRLKLLLDLAHLKVSCATLGLSFEREARLLIEETDYLHISDNDGSADTNEGLVKDSQMFELLQQLDLRSKTITLEVYSGMADLLESYNLVKSLIK